MKDFIIDYESLGNAPRGATIDLSCIVFEFNYENPPTFEELVKSGVRVKFCLQNQKNGAPYPREFDATTMNWWRNQSPEARANLAPSASDVDIKDGLNHILKHITDSGCDPWNCQGWARGMSFDFGILVDQIRQVYQTQETFALEPCKFWNQRDVRTFIEATLMKRGLTQCPLPIGTLNGFIAHDSIHDCAKDILMMLYSVRYALGLQDAPTIDNTDPNTLPKGTRV